MRGRLGALVVLVGCRTPPGEPGSCYHPLDNSCTEHATGAAAARRMCGAANWRPGAGSCPPGSLGTCETHGGLERIYPGPPNDYTIESARSACDFARGTFKVP